MRSEGTGCARAHYIHELPIREHAGSVKLLTECADRSSGTSLLSLTAGPFASEVIYFCHGWDANATRSPKFGDRRLGNNVLVVCLLSEVICLAGFIVVVFLSSCAAVSFYVYIVCFLLFLRSIVFAPSFILVF